jgi:hypothetical protein
MVVLFEEHIEESFNKIKIKNIERMRENNKKRKLKVRKLNTNKINERWIRFQFFA